MKKILFVVALVAALCLSTAIANGASFSDTEIMRVSGTTGYVDLELQSVTLHFDRIQPGEKLAVSWWVKNAGKCPIDITVNIVVTGSAVGQYLTVNFYPGTILYLGPGIWKNVALTAELDTFAGDNYANKSFTVKVTFNATEAGNRNESPIYDPYSWK